MMTRHLNGPSGAHIFALSIFRHPFVYNEKRKKEEEEYPNKINEWFSNYYSTIILIPIRNSN